MEREIKMNRNIEQINGKLIVSCQALENEPLHSSYIMGRMAVAAKEGGAHGIRANTVEDIKEIQSVVDLPVIGIIKKEYADSQVYITPTIKEVDALMEVKPEVIAIDATNRRRPNGETLDTIFHHIRVKYPDQKLLADCATMEEMIYANELGFDFIGTTLVGYTEESKGLEIAENDFAFIREVLEQVSAKVIAEGNIDTPQKAKRVIELGCYTVVVGGAITRPQLITRKFASALEK